MDNIVGIGDYILVGIGYILVSIGYILVGIGYILVGIGYILVGIGYILVGIGYILVAGYIGKQTFLHWCQDLCKWSIPPIIYSFFIRNNFFLQLSTYNVFTSGLNFSFIMFFSLITVCFLVLCLHFWLHVFISCLGI